MVCGLWIMDSSGGDEREEKLGARLIAGAVHVGPDKVARAQDVQVAEIIHILTSARQNVDTHDLEPEIWCVIVRADVTRVLRVRRENPLAVTCKVDTHEAQQCFPDLHSGQAEAKFTSIWC